MKQTSKELKGSRKGKALLFGFCLALMSSVSIFPAFAGTWFSKSRFAYWGGDILLWESQEVEGFLVAGPKDAIPAEDPWIQLYVFDWTCYMTEFSNVQIDFEGKDYLAAGTWEIRKGAQVHTDNASDIAPYMSGLGIAKVAIVTWQADISDMENVLTNELNITDITVVYFTDANQTELNYGKRPDETGKFRPGYVLAVDGLTLGDIDMGFDNIHGHTDWGGYFDSLIFVEFGGILIDGKWSGLVETRIEVNLPSVTSYVPGDVYVTGNWTDFVGDMEGVGTFSGKVTGGNVKYGSVEYAWPSYPPKTNSTHSDPDPRADVNDDHVVNIIDLAQVARAFGATKESERYDSRADINSDSVINILDVAVVAKNFGETF